MKTRLLAAALAILAASCTSKIDYQSGQKERLLVLNAIIRTDESSHRIGVSLSSLRSDTKDLKDAKVDVYLNGDYLCAASYTSPATYPGYPDMPYDAKYIPGPLPESGYYFDADLHEGDELKITAAWEDLSASATARVPKAVQLTSVDTLQVPQTPYFDRIDGLECKVRMKDVPGEDTWMRLLVEYHFDSVSHHPEEGQTDSLRQWFTEAPELFFDDDPNLRGDFHSSREREAIRDNTPIDFPLATNMFCIFSDEGFKDSDYTATVYLRNNFFIPRQGAWDQTVHSRLSFRLLTLSRDDFLFLRAFTNAEANSVLGGNSEFQILFEPVVYPSNVEGGLGLVCIESASDRSFEWVTEVPAAPLQQ